MKTHSTARLTFGLGLRKPHYQDFLAGDGPDAVVPVDFVEVISENFMVAGGRPRDILRRVRARHAVALHGVSLSLGAAQGVDQVYLRTLRQLVDEIEPFIVSDHLCWTGTAGFNSHDLLPLPYTHEALAVACANIGRAQDILGRSLVVENPSSYLQFSPLTGASGTSSPNWPRARAASFCSISTMSMSARPTTAFLSSTISPGFRWRACARSIWPGIRRVANC
jgi:uncharacterized protein (UPF0276 family)